VANRETVRPQTVFPSCTNYDLMTYTPGTGPGQVVATAKLTVRMSHTAGIPDRMALAWGASPSDCGSNDSHRSYVKIPAVSGTSGAGDPYEFTVVVTRVFTTTGPGTVSLYLNAQTVSGFDSTDAIADANMWLVDWRFVP
jgi:hypothetical protein